MATYYICFYDIQSKQIRGIPFILKSHNNTDTTNQNAYFKPGYFNIYNTNRNLFLWIEIFISIKDLYNTTADRWSCHLPNRNKQFTCLQWGSAPLRSHINVTELPPANRARQLYKNISMLFLFPVKRDLLFTNI